MTLKFEIGKFPSIPLKSWVNFKFILTQTSEVSYLYGRQDGIKLGERYYIIIKIQSHYSAGRIKISLFKHLVEDLIGCHIKQDNGIKPSTGFQSS